MEKLLGEMTDKEFNDALMNLDEYIGSWMNKNNIRAGSHLSNSNKSGSYSIYNAIKKALRQEYHQAKPCK